MRTFNPFKPKSLILLVKFCVIFSLTMAQLACSQLQPCNVTEDQVSEIRGFRLGMSLEQIQARFKDFPSPPANEFGLATVIIDPSRKDEIRPETGYTFVNAARYTEFNDVNRMYLKLVDGSVAEIEVYYKNDLRWQSVDEFVSKISESLKVSGDWKKSGEDSKSIICTGFYIRAGIQRDYLQRDKNEKLPYVLIADGLKSNQPMIREMNKNENINRAEQEHRKVFKP